MGVGVEAVLITGVFGVGKSTVAADLADVLEAAGVKYAALDLDWLTWSNANGPTRADEHRMMIANLIAVVDNYRVAGATRFVMARTIRDSDELDSLTDALGMSVRTVELIVPLAEIAIRLHSHPTEGREGDLSRTAEWISSGLGSGLGGIAVMNDRPVREVTAEILHWLGWVHSSVVSDDSLA